ncbi:MAG: hypothetical protein AAGM38_01650 [Pseudomonadota bacterium]
MMAFDVTRQDVETAEKTLLDACCAGTVEAHGRMNGGESREEIAPHEFADAQFYNGKLMSLKEGAFGQQKIEGRPTWSDVVFDAKNVKSLFANPDGQAAGTSIPSPDPREFSGNAAAWYGDGGRAVVEARMRRIWPEAPKILPQGVRTWFAAEIWNERCPDHPRTPSAFKEFEKRDNRK